MCIHTEEDMNRLREELEVERKGKSPVGFVIMRDTAGAFQEAYYCDVLDPQAVANTIRNLRAWHPGDHIVDLSEVNAKLYDQHYAFKYMEKGEAVHYYTGKHPQYMQGHYWVDENGFPNLLLPPPTGEAPASEDVNVHATEIELEHV